MFLHAMIANQSANVISYSAVITACSEWKLVAKVFAQMLGCTVPPLF